MSRMQTLRPRLSKLPDTPRRIIYLITEDRRFLEELFVSQADILKNFSDPVFADKASLKSENMYRVCVENGYLVDLYQYRDPVQGTFSFDRITQDPRLKPPFYFLTHFHDLTPHEQTDLLRKFLYESERREALRQPAYLFLLSPLLSIPTGFRQDIEILDVPEMDDEDILDYLTRAARSARPQRPLEQLELARIRDAATDMKGLSRWEIADILREMNGRGHFYGETNVSYDQTQSEIDKITRRRQELVKARKKQNAFEDDTVLLLDPQDSVAGLDNLLSWINQVGADLRNPKLAHSWGLEAPRGVVLTGIPGCGKTSAAKKAAYDMGVSLVEMRMENLLGSHVGDSEARFKRYRKQVESMAPVCVLIDEIEIMFDKKKSDSSNVRDNILTALLSWLQSNDKQIFFFATCNSVSGVPEALVRPRRFDRVSCTFLPSRKELAQILNFHLHRADRLSGGTLLKKMPNGPAGVVDSFLDWVTEQIRAGRDMFHTGASIEQLVNDTNLYLRTRYLDEKEPNSSIYLSPSADTYLEALKTISRMSDHPAYGETNMSTIVRFWIGALENKYASASSDMPIPFHAFNPTSGRFDPAKLPACTGYDQLMQERLKKYIEQFWKANRR